MNTPPLPRIPDCNRQVNIDQFLRKLGLPTTERNRARTFWALEAHRVHGWSPRHTRRFILTGHLPDPNELEPRRVVLLDLNTVRLRVDYPRITISVTDLLPHQAVRLLYHNRFTHIAVDPAAEDAFTRRMAYLFGRHTVSGLRSDVIEGRLIIDTPAVILLPTNDERDLGTPNWRVMFEMYTFHSNDSEPSIVQFL